MCAAGFAAAHDRRTFQFTNALEPNTYGKGAPAQESRTGTRLVCPAAGSEKKIWPLQDRASQPQIWYIRT